MKRLVAAVRAWFSRNLPSDEQLVADTPEMRDFYNRMERDRARRNAERDELVAIARRQLEAIHEGSR